MERIIRIKCTVPIWDDSAGHLEFSGEIEFQRIERHPKFYEMRVYTFGEEDPEPLRHHETTAWVNIAELMKLFDVAAEEALADVLPTWSARQKKEGSSGNHA